MQGPGVLTLARYVTKLSGDRSLQDRAPQCAAHLQLARSETLCQGATAVVLGVPGDGYPPAIGLNDVALRDGVYCVVGTLHVKLRPEHGEKVADIRSVKEEHVVGTCERRDQLRALGRWDEGPPRSFIGAGGAV